MIKLYDNDSYISEFSAKVVSCEEFKDGYLVGLDKTAFFPTAGGQEFDRGTISNQEVLDVFVRENNTYHFVKNKFEIGEEVFGKIDWKIRYRKMQHHSAEHIVSGIVFSKYGANNVGFHLSDREVTFDFDMEFSKDEYAEIERLANATLQENHKISAYYPKKEELEKIEYRAKLDLSENVRIVEIEGIDKCACCAPHVKSTGEIGVIKFTDAIRHRGGCRITMICGMDAIKDYQYKSKEIIRISNLLSAKVDFVDEEVENLLVKNGELKQEINSLKKKILELKAENIEITDENFCVFLDECDTNLMRYFANLIKDNVKGITAIFSPDPKGGYSYLLTSKNINLTKISKQINESLNGRGGGKDEMQGKFLASKEEITKYFKATSF